MSLVGALKGEDCLKYDDLFQGEHCGGRANNEVSNEVVKVIFLDLKKIDSLEGGDRKYKQINPDEPLSSEGSMPSRLALEHASRELFKIHSKKIAEIAPTASHDRYKVGALLKIFHVCLEWGDIEEAIKMAYEFPNICKSTALEGASIFLIDKKNDVERAIEIARTIPNEVHRDSTFMEIVYILHLRNNFGKTIEIIEMISADYRPRAIEEIVNTLNKLGQIEKNQGHAEKATEITSHFRSLETAPLRSKL